MMWRRCIKKKVIGIPRNPISCVFRVSLIFVCAVFLCPVCFAQEYGLVLSGGGAKGAYEVGVWKALKKFGIAQKVTVISGTSVGGLNAALFSCVDDIEEIESLWRKNVPLELTHDSAKGDVLISQQGIKNVIGMIPLNKLQEKFYPRVIVTTVRERFSVVKFFLTQLAGRDATHRFVLNDEKKICEIENKLLATSAFPVLTMPVKLDDGFYYVDGGNELIGGDNIPILPITDGYENVRNIIVVYLEDLRSMRRRIDAIDYSGHNLIEIIPSINLGDLFSGTTNFSALFIDLLINKGFEDTARVLKDKGFSEVSSSWWE